MTQSSRTLKQESREILSPREVQLARAWLADCQWGDIDEDRDPFAAMAPDQISRGIAQHYEGGIRQFIADGQS